MKSALIYQINHDQANELLDELANILILSSDSFCHFCHIPADTLILVQLAVQLNLTNLSRKNKWWWKMKLENIFMFILLIRWPGLNINVAHKQRADHEKSWIKH